MKEEIKNCPFCGREPVVEECLSLAGVKSYQIYCPSIGADCCHPSTWFWNDLEDAIKQWQGYRK